AETPVLRPDGSVLDAPGYDPATGLLYEPGAVFPPVPPTPSLADAKGAADQLLRLVDEFPFARAEHRAAWLAAALTPLARFAVAGPCPLFVFDANPPGSGKTLLVDAVSIIATGREAARTPLPPSDEELHKVITAVALAGDRLMLIDNVAAPLGGASLDAA